MCGRWQNRDATNKHTAKAIYKQTTTVPQSSTKNQIKKLLNENTTCQYNSPQIWHTTNTYIISKQNINGRKECEKEKSTQTKNIHKQCQHKIQHRGQLLTNTKQNVSNAF